MPEAIRQGDIPGVQLRCRARLEVGADTAWRLLTEPQQHGDWLAAVVEGDAAAVGSTLRWRNDEAFDPAVIEIGDTLELEPPRRWRLAWRQEGWSVATQVEIEIEEVADGSALSILHGGFEHLPLSASLTVWEAYRRHWRAALERLAAIARAD